MKKLIYAMTLVAAVLAGCKSKEQASNNGEADKTFLKFEDTFLDAYWNQYPTGSIFTGYGKYYDKLVIPDSAAFASRIAFSNCRRQFIGISGAYTIIQRHRRAIASQSLCDGPADTSRSAGNQSGLSCE